jgi:hypothetical protein
MRPAPILLLALMVVVGAACVALLWILTSPAPVVVKPALPPSGSPAVEEPAPTLAPPVEPSALPGPQGPPTRDRKPATPPTGAAATRPEGGPASGVQASGEDRTPPVVTLLDPRPGDLLGSASVTVRGLVDDRYVTQVTIGGEQVPVLDGVFAHELTLREGVNIIVVEAVGPGEVRGEGSVTVEADLEPPHLEVLEPPTGQVARPPQLVVRGRIDDLRATVLVGDQPVLVGGDGTFAARVAVPPGLEGLAVTARDRLGRIARTVIPVSPPVSVAEQPDRVVPPPSGPGEKRQYRPAPRRDISTEPLYVHLLRYCERGRFEEARERVRKLLEEEGYRETRFECTIWLALARGYDEHEELELALDAYRRCFESCDPRKGAWHAAQQRIRELTGE